MRFKAFISYSHRDENWARWLQRALESYRIPRHLVGKPTPFGKVPSRLSPVFRDREDLSSATDLSQSIKHELERSESMVVVCSPASAQSHWVNEEIRYFRSLGRSDRIHALIVDGEPESDDPERYCYPEALILQSDGSRKEPLAADARKWADGKLLSRLKLIAGILGIRLDDLRRRDMQRRHRLWMASSIGALTIAIVTSVLAVMAINARNAAENRREHAEDLVGYMVGDLRSKLATVGRLDILDSMGGQVTQYLDTLDPNEVTDESLTQQAKVWRQLGQVSRDQGKFSEALESFTKSRDVLAELYRRAPDNPDRLFELGQAEFWLGYINADIGDLAEAERGLTNYLEISNELLNQDPSNPEWTMEVSYALGNMGWLEGFREGANPDRMLEYMQSSLDHNRDAVMLAPENTDFRVALTHAHADLADAYLMVCNLAEALENRLRNVELSERFYQESPSDTSLKDDLAYALSGLGKVQQLIGLTVQALDNYRGSEKMLMELYLQDPTNLNYRWNLQLRKQRIATVLGETGRQEEALALFSAQAPEFREIRMMNDGTYFDATEEYLIYLNDFGKVAYQAGDQLLAETLLEEEMKLVTEMVTEHPDYATSRLSLVFSAFRYWDQNGVLPDPEIMETLNGYLDDPAEIRSCEEADAASRLALMYGDAERAGDYASYLLERGFYEPGFIQFCRRHGLCQQ